MSSRWEIRMDFQQAMNQARRLDEIADRLEKVAKKFMEQSMQNLASAWKGTNASAFLHKEEGLQGKIKATADNVREIADDIRRVAKRVYDAETTAWQISNERKS